MLRGLFSFNCRFETEAVLPAFKGSVFRGMFGRSLRSVVCAIRRQDCATCLLKQRCLYAHVFETLPSEYPTAVLRQGGPPHPFVIQVPDDNRSNYQPGSLFSFNLMLFGEVNDSLPYFVYAIEQMGLQGIGRPINGCRGRFAIDTVCLNGKTIYNAVDGCLHTDFALETIDLLPPPDNTFNEITVTLETPLRLKFANCFAADLPFHVLVRAMLRRISSLMICYDQGEPKLDYKGLVARAANIRADVSGLRWVDWNRYSARQNAEMAMGGMMGEVTYWGALAEFMPLFSFCEKVHLGKQTAFGLGQLHYHAKGEKG